jgi:hypothetical protein
MGVNVSNEEVVASWLCGDDQSMNFRTPVVVSLPIVKEFVYDAKRRGFAASDVKMTLPDQTSVYSYRPFGEPRFAGMIYADIYGGNTVEGGQESVTIDLVLRWRNQYYGGTHERFWDLETNAGGIRNLDDTLRAIGPRFSEVVSAFLKEALMHLPPEFPVRGPSMFRATEVQFEDARFGGEWIYTNMWEALPLFDNEDPFAAYTGQERISLNGTEVYWHAYQGGFVRDKYFPLILRSS